MVVNQNDLGESVYLEDFNNKASRGLYVAVRDLVVSYGAKNVLDYGCSNLVASAKLLNEGDIRLLVGIDGDKSAIVEARTNCSKAMLLQKDLELDKFLKELPNLIKKYKIDTVVALDIFEHLEYKKGKQALKILRESCVKPVKIIISLPIISYMSIPTWLAYVKMLITMKKPQRGVLDRTHKQWIFKGGTKAHEKLFNESGLKIKERFYTNMNSEVVKRGDVPSVKGYSLKDKIIYTFSRQLLPMFLSPIYSKSKVIEALEAFQGVYVLN